MKNRVSGGDRRNDGDNAGGSNSAERKNPSKILKRNKRRLGGGGLSLEAFANLKARSNGYNPAIISASSRGSFIRMPSIRKYKKALKKENMPNELSLKIEPLEYDIEAKDDRDTRANNRAKKNKHKTHKLNELYEQKHQEEDKARNEREAIIQAKEQARKEAESRRNGQPVMKKTRSGQPVMKYRMEQLLDTIQASEKHKLTNLHLSFDFIGEF